MVAASSCVFSGIIWYNATEINSIQLHDFSMMLPLESISSHLRTVRTFIQETLEFKCHHEEHICLTWIPSRTASSVYGRME